MIAGQKPHFPFGFLLIFMFDIISIWERSHQVLADLISY